jgi:hypothetical protein
LFFVFLALHTKPHPIGPQSPPWGSLILWPCSFALPGLCYTKLPPFRPTWSPSDEPLRLGIHRHSQSLLVHAPKACHAWDIHMHDLHSAGPHTPGLSNQGSPDTQDLHSSSLCPSGTPSPHSKGLYFTSGKGLHQ